MNYVSNMIPSVPGCRSSLRLRATAWDSFVQPDITEPKANRFDIEFLFQSMEHFIADDAAIAQIDGRQAFGIQCLVPQAAKRFRACFECQSDGQRYQLCLDCHVFASGRSNATRSHFPRMAAAS